MIAVDPIWQLVMLLVTHWVGDFLFQTTWMATSKSRRLDALTAHVLIYSLALSVTAVLIFGPNALAAAFIACNAVLHFVTDFFTSKVSAALHAKQNMRGFYVVLGLDQLLHHIALAATLVWFSAT